MVWEGRDVIERSKKILGYINPGMLSGNFCVIEGGRNILLTSQDRKEADREMALWFSDSEVASWSNHSKAYILQAQFDVENDNLNSNNERILPFGDGVFDDLEGKHTLTVEDFEK
jgi:hypothetical protein